MIVHIYIHRNSNDRCDAFDQNNFIFFGIHALIYPCDTPFSKA